LSAVRPFLRNLSLDNLKLVVEVLTSFFFPRYNNP